MTMILTEKKNDIILRDYQQEAVSFLNDNDGKLVLAMCPSSGKTETIIYYLNQQYNLNPNLKVLILPHSTNVLLDNFYQRLELRNVDFSYSANINDDVNVHVILPQNHNKIVGHYDLIIIDEAHENYLAKTIQGIIKKTQAGKEILLTGTPSKFIGKNDFKLHFVALSDLCELYTPKLRIDIIESDYDWNGNYNESTKELKTSYKFSKESTEISLKKTFDFLLKRNDSDSVEKTLIVCRNIAQSNYVKEYLTTIGFSSEISNSDNDKDSENVSKFKNNLIDILIVVNRARLGYDDADLINLIDISGTLNPNIIYQMFARLLRGTQDMKKYYIRLSSKNDDVYNSEIATSVALMLTHTNYIKVFNGKNFNSQEIIVNSDFFIKSKKSLDKSSGKGKTLSKRKLFIDIQEDDKFDVINFFKEVIEKKEKNVGLYKFCKVTEVLSQLRFNNGKSITKEECIENARKYSSAKEWRENSPKIYGYANRKGWYKECSAHFINLNGISRTKEECIQNALKYKSIKEWLTGDRKVYLYSHSKGWMEECTAHFINLRGISKTKEECIEDAKQYKTSKEWRENSPKIYGYAKNKGWYFECISMAQMISLRGISRTKEECIEDANKYKTVKEWRKNSPTIYSYSVGKKWIKECSAHFINLKGISRTLEECIEDANKYKSDKEWRENSRLIYGYAVNKKWYNECTANLIKTKVGRTKEECIEDAKKYKTCADWIRSSPKIYGYAVDKKWIDECKSYLESKTRWKLTLEECIEDAKKHKSVKEWKEKNKGIYEYCQRKKWLKDCTPFLEKGSSTKTLEQCIEDAKKYKTKKEWQKNSKTIYYYVTYKRWFKEINNHFEIKTQNIKTKKECIEDAKKYKSSSEWKKNSRYIYNYASMNKWIKECTADMINLRGVSRTLEECIEDAKKYKYFEDWKKNSPKIYGYAKNKGWVKKCTAHFIDLINKPITEQTKFTLEECIVDAIKYNNRKEWSENSPKIFTYGYNKWKKECTAHFVPIKKSNNISKNECIVNAKKYKSLAEWKKYDLIYYNKSYNMGWYKECSAHFINLRGKSRTKEECITDAKKYETKSEWIKNSSTIYNYVRDKKWLEECSEHFEK